MCAPGTQARHRRQHEVIGGARAVLEYVDTIACEFEQRRTWGRGLFCEVIRSLVSLALRVVSRTISVDV